MMLPGIVRGPLWGVAGVLVVVLLVLHGIDRYFARTADITVREAKAFLAGATTHRSRMAQLKAAIAAHERAGRAHRTTARATVSRVRQAAPLPPPPPGCEQWVQSLSSQVAELLGGAAAQYERAAKQDSLALVDARTAIATAEARRDSAERKVEKLITVARRPRLWLELGGEIEAPSLEEPTVQARAALRLQDNLVVAVGRDQEVTGDRRGEWVVEGRKTFRIF